ncbi:MAG TPA: ATP-binding protein, partial [Planctomycetota bacterium]|nr:ATP-binding protein [Planctomycetota bacterium]
LTHSFGILIIAGLAGALAQRVFQSRLLQEEILENLNEGVLLVDPKGNVVYRNSIVDQLLRMPPGPRPWGMGTTLETLLQPLDYARIKTYLQKPVRIDFILQDSAQVERIIEAGIVPLNSIDSGGGIIIQLKDVSLERMLEDTARDRQRLEAMREIGAMMAHEVRNPLATVHGYAQEILRKSSAVEPLASQARAILEQSDRIDGIIETFLKFSRMPAPEPFLCDMGELANRVIAGLEVRPDAEAVEFLLEIEPQDKPMQARIDPGQIEQVLVNLGINALQAMEATAAPRRLGFRLQEETDHPAAAPVLGPNLPNAPAEPAQVNPPRPGILVVIEDSGPGLPKKNTDEIFKPFYTTKNTGTGLGLSIAMKIVNAHGGWIKTGESRWGGAKFLVFLPE